jgi:hypothetical protein
MVQLDRRAFLRIGSIAPFGLWSGVLRARWNSQRELSVIHLLLGGGLSHIDTFDMKPEANPKFRGIFKPIATNVDGLQICEHLPLTARQANKFTVIRSMTHKEYSHESAMALLLTGQPRNATVSAPSIGSAVLKEFGPRNDLPAYVAIPAARPSAQAAPERMRSPRARAAFDIAAEPEALREKYGPTAMGQGCLLARRLVESGVRMVTVNCGNWDHHADIFNKLANDRLPALDRAYSTLLEDLDQRGLLDSTIVLLSGEFGRTPAINAYGGRDHWPGCFSLTIAGGGIEGGRVVGSTDKDGMFVRDHPVEIPDLLATLYHKLGIGHSIEYASRAGRPVKLSGREPLKFL